MINYSASLIWIVAWITAVALSYLPFSEVLQGAGYVSFLACSVAIVLFVSDALIKVPVGGFNASRSSIQPVVIATLLGAFLAIVLLEAVAFGFRFPILKLFDRPYVSYKEYGIASLHGLVNSIYLVVTMLCFHRVLTRKAGVLSWLMVILLFTYPIIIFSRQVLISVFVQLALMTYYYKWRNRITVNTVIRSTILVAVIIAIFGYLGNRRLETEEFAGVAVFENIYQPTTIGRSVPVGLQWVQLYVVSAINNLEYNVRNAMPVGSVLLFFDQLMPSVIRGELVGDEGFYNYSNFVISIENMNMGTIFIGPYLALGWIGFGLMALFIVSGNMLFRMLIRGGVYGELCYISFLAILALSPFVNMLFYLPVSFQLVMLSALNILANTKLVRRTSGFKRFESIHGIHGKVG